MARTRYLDYRAEDSTELFNNTLRGMVLAGVYLGFSVGVGSSGTWWLKFTHDTDPDKILAGGKLGFFVSRDGVTVSEDADQDNVVNGSAPGGSDEIHWVVASYVYNKALPNNDVSYVVKTAVAPSTPTLTDDEVLLAEIFVPTGSTSYSSTGVDIKTVAKKSLYDLNEYLFWQKTDNILKPGIYHGFNMVVGSSDLKIDLQEGDLITKENAKITETAQPDLFTLSAVADTHYRFAWVVCLHKNEDTDPQPSPDYLLVEGTEQWFADEASLPSDSDILTAAGAVDAKYDDSIYVNKLGYVRVQNIGGTYTIQYIRGETYLDEDTRHVYGAEYTQFDRSGKYYGHEGLLQAIADIYAISKDQELVDKPWTLVLDGTIHVPTKTIELPSNIRLLGNGAPAILQGAESEVINARGYYAEWDTSNDTIALGTPTALPSRSGYVVRKFQIQSTYQSTPNLQDRFFSRGDRVKVYGDADDTVYEGIIWEVTDTWEFDLYIETQYQTDGDPLDLDIILYKKNIHIDNIKVEPLVAASHDAGMVIGYVEDCFFDRLDIKELWYFQQNRSTYGTLKIRNAVTWSGNTSSLGASEHNRFEHIHFDAPISTTIGIGSGSYYASVGMISYDDVYNAIDLNIQFWRSSIGRITANVATGSDIFVQGGYQKIGAIYVPPTSKLQIANTGNLVVYSQCTELEFNGAYATVLFSAHSTFTNTAANPTNRCLLDASSSDMAGVIEALNEDRNLRFVSDALISWNAGTGELTWDGDIKIDIPWQTGYTKIAAGGVTLGTSGDRAYLDVDRDATGDTTKTVSTRAKSSAASDRYYRHRVNLAIRFNDTVYLWDGTRVEDGASLRIGQTPPPDESVTYDKLAETAIAFHNKVFRDYVAVENNNGWENSMPFMNETAIAFTYTASTGVVQFASAVDLSRVQKGDFIILREVNFDPTDVNNRAHTLEEVLDVDDSVDTVTIAKGLSFTVGSGHVWNGSIGRGNKVFTNESLVGYTYIAEGANYGRITYNSNQNWGQYQVREGYVFVDASYQKFQILERDVSGLGRWVRIVTESRIVDVSTSITDPNQGSIEINNNPYDISLADCATLLGAEYIPLDRPGMIDNTDESLVRKGQAGYFGHATVGVTKHYSNPYDPRVKIYSANSQEIGAFFSNWDSQFFPEDQESVVVDFTGVCTGAVIGFRGNASYMGRFFDQRTAVYVDGERVGPIYKADPNCIYVYGYCFNNHELAVDNQAYPFRNDTDGQSFAGSPNFDSANGSFVLSGVRPGDVLVLLDGADAGTYEILSITSATRVVLTTNLTTTAGPGITWEIYETGAEKMTQAMRLPQGIHNIKWVFSSTVNLGIRVTRMLSGIYVLNQPAVDSATRLCSDGPGTAVMKGGVRSFPYQLERPKAAQTPVPVSDENWDKGGRIVRYVKNDGSHQWAKTDVRGFTDTGTVAGSSPLIQNVGSISQWRIGDLVLIISTGDTTPDDYMISRISNIGGTTITMADNAPVTWSGVKTIYFYGTCKNGYAFDPYPVNAGDRSREEVAVTFRMLDFIGPDSLDANKTLVARKDQAIGVFGMRQNDMMTAVSGYLSSYLQYNTASIFYVDEQGLKITQATTDFIRITFVGTGLSLSYLAWNYPGVTNGDVSVRIDGALLGNLAKQYRVGDWENSYPEADLHGTFMVGELPYGTHVIEFRCTAAAAASGGLTAAEAREFFKVFGFTVFQPKKPEIEGTDLPALELLDTNFLGDTEAQLGVEAESTLQRSQMGNLQYDACSIISPGSKYVPHVEDDDEKISAFGSFNDRFLKAANTTTSDGRVIYVPFFGTEVTTITRDITVPSGAIYFELLDHDGQWKAPGSTTGFTSQGLSSVTSTVTTDGYRLRWIVSKLGFHVFRIRFDADNQDYQLDSIEIGCPYHAYRTKKPVMTDLMVPYQNGGLDVKNRVPFDSSIIPDTQDVQLQGYTSEMYSWASPEYQDPFIFYTRGGLVTIECQFSLDFTGDTGDNVINMIVDGGLKVSSNDQRTYIRHDNATGGYMNLVSKITLYLKPGFHFAYMEVNIATMTVRNLNWTALSVEPSEALASKLNGSGKPFMGLSSPRGSY